MKTINDLYDEIAKATDREVITAKLYRSGGNEPFRMPMRSDWPMVVQLQFKSDTPIETIDKIFHHLQANYGSIVFHICLVSNNKINIYLPYSQP